MMWKILDQIIGAYAFGVLLVLIGESHMIRWWKLKITMQTIYKLNKQELFQEWQRTETKYLKPFLFNPWLSWVGVFKGLMALHKIRKIFKLLIKAQEEEGSNE